MKNFIMLLCILGLVFGSLDGVSSQPIQNPSNGHWYDLLPGDWHEVEDAANALGGHLVTINDQAEQDWLYDTFGMETQYWIGFNDEENEGDWVWASGEPVTYTNWAVGEPNNTWESGEHYAEINWGPNGEWNDIGLDSPEWDFVTEGIVEFNSYPNLELIVDIDIKPGSCPNPLNVKSKGVLPLAVLGIENFDVTTIDPATIRLSREGIEGDVAPLRWSYEDVATPFSGELCDCHGLNGDGFMDLTLKLNTQELVGTLNLEEIAGETIPFTLTGNLKEEYGGTPIEGKDCIWMKTKDNPFPLDVQVGGFSSHFPSSYVIQLYAQDPNHLADSIIVTGPGIVTPLALTYEVYRPGEWWSDPNVDFGSNPPDPPLTYTFQILSDGTEYIREVLIESFVHEFATDLSPSGSASGQITFTWTGVSIPGATYFVQFYYESGDDWNSPHTTGNSITYGGEPLTSGTSYSYCVVTNDSYGNGSFGCTDFVYDGAQEETYIFERMWPELHSQWYFSSPAYVATDNNDLVYISDYNNYQIQVFTANGDLVSKWPITEYGEYELGETRAITVDQDGFVYVVAGVSNGVSSILKLNPSGEIVDKIGSYADFPGTCGFSNPCAIDVDNSGNFYVTDEVNQRIEKLAPDGSLITTWGSLGSGPGQFNDPTGIAVDRQNNWVYVLDSRNLRTQKFTTDGVYLTHWQSIDSATDYGGVGITVDDDGYVYVSNTASNEIRKFTGVGELEATLYNIVGGSFGIAIDSGGYIYCADFHGNRVEKISPDGTQNWIWTSAGTANGYFDWPWDVALDSNGNVYVADQNNARIQKFDSQGNFISAWQGPGGPIAIDTSDNVYVMGESSVLKYDVNGGLLTEWGSQGSGDGQFNWVNGIAVDQQGYVYVVDAGNFRIQKFTSDGTFVTKWGSQGSGNGQFILPWAIDVDSNGNVYVTDSDQHNVQIFTTDGEFVAKWEEQGFGAPRGIAIDESNNVYVCSVKGYIQKLTSEGVLITEFGDSGSEPGYLAGPNGIEVDSAERIYVAETNNNRIQVFTKVSP